MRFYGEAIDRARKRKERTLATIVRAAHHYEGDAFLDFLKD